MAAKKSEGISSPHGDRSAGSATRSPRTTGRQRWLCFSSTPAGSKVSPTSARPLPPDGLTAALLADHVTVRAETVHRPRANWMAALVDPAGLVSALRPVWQARLCRSASDSPRRLEVHFDQSGVVSLQVREQGEATDFTLPAKVLLPILVGFRNATWRLRNPTCSFLTIASPYWTTCFRPCSLGSRHWMVFKGAPLASRNFRRGGPPCPPCSEHNAAFGKATRRSAPTKPQD